MSIEKEEYVEPACLLCEKPFGAEPEIRTVPQRRILEKVDEYMSRRDYAGVERHLLYWLEEARLGRDTRGELMIRGELVGHYRKVRDREHAYEQAAEVLRLIDALGFGDTMSAGTEYVNVATVYQAFGDDARAMEVFQKAQAVYEAIPSTRPELLGGLYNNMALACVSLGRFDEARALYEQALGAMARVPNGCLEQAITYLNMADAAVAEHGGETDVEPYLDKAYDLLMTEGVPHDGYFAFVCEKCAPSFDYYGYFMAAEKLKTLSKEIYERA